MKIFITGIAGFIASHIAKKMTLLGNEVVGIDNFNNYYSVEVKRDNARHLLNLGIKIIEDDIISENYNYVKEMEDSDILIHFAAQPGISEKTKFDDYLKNNVLVTKKLLDIIALFHYKPFFINIATSSIYGRIATENENFIPQPISDYGVTKLIAEQMILSSQRNNKLNATSLRLFSVFGPGERPEKLFPNLIYSILTKKPFTLFEGSREHSRSFTYVSDIIDAIVKVIERKELCNGEIINIGSDIEIKTGEAIDLIENLIGEKANFKILPPRKGDQDKTFANIEKAKRILNYTPVITPEKGFIREIKWIEYIIKENIKLY